MKIKINWRKETDGNEQCFATANIGTQRWIVAAGSNEAEAVGNLILDDEQEFGVEIEREDVDE